MVTPQEETATTFVPTQADIEGIEFDRNLFAAGSAISLVVSVANVVEHGIHVLPTSLRYLAIGALFAAAAIPFERERRKHIQLMQPGDIPALE